MPIAVGQKNPRAAGPDARDNAGIFAGETKESAIVNLSPPVTFLIVLVIGVLAGLIFDHLAGPGWLKRQIAGAMPSMVTSALVGVAGAFVGFHLAEALRLTADVALLGAAVGAAVILLGWRTVR
jgi:uncharacterized membrane protein YeaQ/YmgE (transglycosylase-associated protein family)